MKALIKKQPLTTTLTAIDELARDHQAKIKTDYEEYIFNKDTLQEWNEKSGIPISSPLEQGEPEPQSIQELDIHLQLFPKQRYIMEMYDLLELSREIDDWKQIQDECVEDIAEVGRAAIRVKRDNKGFVRTRRCIPENMVSTNFRSKDGRDMVACGEYIEMSISQLKSWAGNQFTEEQYMDIVAQAVGRTYELEYSYQYDNHNYPYDTEKITVLDMEFHSPDKYVHLIEKDEFGNLTKVAKKNWDYPKDPQGKNIPDDVYEAQQAKEGRNRKIIRRDIDNLYQCSWIVGTKYVFDYGLVTNQEKVSNMLGDVRSSFKIYNLFDSPFRLAEPVLDNIQVNWLKYQHHVANSRVGGLSIEMSAMENITLGQGKAKLTPKQALDLYFETGILLWRRKDYRAASNQWKPIDELKNEMNSGAAFHFNQIIADIDLLRTILGYNEITDASTPDPEVGKRLGEFAVQGTNNAMEWLYEAWRSLYEDVVEGFVFHIPEAMRTFKHPGLVNALGMPSYSFVANSTTFSQHEYSVKVEVGMDEEKRQVVQRYIESNLKKNGGPFDLDDVMEVEMEHNFVRAVHKLRLLKQRAQQRAQQAEMANIQANEESNQRAATTANNMEIEKEKALAEIEKEKDAHRITLEVEADREKTMNQVIIHKLQNGHELTKQEQEHLQDLAEIDRKGMWDLKKARAKPATPNADKKPTESRGRS
jgi:hypothetical protein